ncbi:MAG: chemotaxis protein CheW [Ekhidna sp.]|uniref:chemotaxis protein CheW n=1 Tax=Ekhidna sp. TaxID=2608089 RepID=UPI0032EDCC1B
MALGNNLNKKSTSERVEANPVLAEKQGNEKVASETQVLESENEKSEAFHQFCVFSSGGEEYAIPINLVKEVVPFPPIAEVPQMPEYILGMANVRGNIFGVLDLKTFFQGEDDSETNYRFMLVLEHDIFQMSIAIPDVPDTLMVSGKMIEKLTASRLKSVLGQKYLKGIIKKDKRMIILFDILGMISSEKFTQTS